jgi:hypothetical protein
MDKNSISGRTTDPRWPQLLLLSPEVMNQVSGGINPQPLPPGRALTHDINLVNPQPLPPGRAPKLDISF